MLIEECQHAQEYLFITDSGQTVQCGGCGLRKRLSVQQAQLMMAPKAGEKPAQPPKPGELVYGPNMAQLAMIARRLDFALRAMGKAFYHGDHTPKQEHALELAVDAANGFKKLQPNLQRHLDLIVAAFPDAEPLWHESEKETSDGQG